MFLLSHLPGLAAVPSQATGSVSVHVVSPSYKPPFYSTKERKQFGDIIFLVGHQIKSTSGRRKQ